MTRSIFDPSGGETEHSGSRNFGPAAGNNSSMPQDIVDGKVGDDEEASGVATTPEEGAERLASMVKGEEEVGEEDGQAKATGG